MSLATLTKKQSDAVHHADQQITTLGGAARVYARPLFKTIVELDHKLEIALKRILQLEDELEARKDNP